MDVVDLAWGHSLPTLGDLEVSRSSSIYTNRNTKYGEGSPFSGQCICVQIPFSSEASTQGLACEREQVNFGSFCKGFCRDKKEWQALWIPSLEQEINTEFIHMWWLLVTSICKIKTWIKSLSTQQNILLIEEAKSSKQMPSAWDNKAGFVCRRKLLKG